MDVSHESLFSRNHVNSVVDWSKLRRFTTNPRGIQYGWWIPFPWEPQEPDFFLPSGPATSPFTAVEAMVYGFGIPIAPSHGRLSAAIHLSSSKKMPAHCLQDLKHYEILIGYSKTKIEHFMEWYLNIFLMDIGYLFSFHPYPIDNVSPGNLMGATQMSRRVMYLKIGACQPHVIEAIYSAASAFRNSLATAEACTRNMRESSTWSREAMTWFFVWE